MLKLKSVMTEEIKMFQLKLWECHGFHCKLYGVKKINLI